MLAELLASLRLALATMLLCCVGYVGIVLGASMALAPQARVGALIERDGTIVGSRRLAQGFTRDEYIWPRPSAVGYRADAAGGSNLAPDSPRIRERAVEIVARCAATPDHPIPAELVLASGSGLDPDLGEAAAMRQAPRVADARHVPTAEVVQIIRAAARPTGPGHPARLVNVLELNLELDRRFGRSVPRADPARSAKNDRLESTHE